MLQVYYFIVDIYYKYDRINRDIKSISLNPYINTIIICLISSGLAQLRIMLSITKWQLLLYSGPIKIIICSIITVIIMAM